MKLTTLVAFLFLLASPNLGFLHSKKNKGINITDVRILSNVKIFSNMAEIVQPLSKLPVEFSAEEWADVRTDSVTLVGPNVNVTEQTITEKRKSMNNAEVYIRSPSSSSSSTNMIKATIVDEKRNLVKFLDKDITKEAVYMTVSENEMVFAEPPSKSKFYLNFTYDTNAAVYLSYLRTNLNWKTSYQLNLFEETKPAVLISMADIRNDGQTKVDVEHAELLGGDINLQTGSNQYRQQAFMHEAYGAARADFAPSPKAISPQISRGEESAGLYVYTIDEPFSIEARTNYLLPMFRPRATVDRFASISNHFYGSAMNSTGKARRAYRLSADRFLSHGNCLIREQDRLVGETVLPDLAAKDKHEFSIGQETDVTFKENLNLISTRVFNESLRLGSRDIVTRSLSVYEVSVSVKNFKTTRGVKVEYENNIHGQSVKLFTPNTMFTQEGSKIKTSLTVGADETKNLTYKFEVVN